MKKSMSLVISVVSVFFALADTNADTLIKCKGSDGSEKAISKAIKGDKVYVTIADRASGKSKAYFRKSGADSLNVGETVEIFRAADGTYAGTILKTDVNTYVRTFSKGQPKPTDAKATYRCE